jgi:hypothetical protein
MMPTLKQRKAAQRTKDVLENKLNEDGGTILENVGYSLAIAKNPKYVFESKGFKVALEELGFSVEAADMTMAKILRTGKEENQIKAGQEIYKRLGAYEQGDSPKITNLTQIIINPPDGSKDTINKSNS